MISIVQITDCHLLAEPHGTLKDVATRPRLEAVLAALRRWDVPIERLILTGDLAHDHLATTYDQLRQLLADWLPHLRLIPGNHDDRDAMREVFDGRVQVVGARNIIRDEVGPWTILGLDTQVPGQLYGSVGPEQLAWLGDQLEQSRQRPTVLFLHHPPTLVMSAWLDVITLQDSAALLPLLIRHPQVKLVCSGHVHQELTFVGPPVLVTTPSTSLQFRPRTETLEIDSAACPGFRVLELHDDGAVHTRVIRVPPPGWAGEC